MSQTRDVPETSSNETLTLFSDYFQKKAVCAIAKKLTKDILKMKNYNANQIAWAQRGVYLAIIMLQGSIKTSGTAFSVTTLMECLGYSDNNAYWAGFAAGVAASWALDSSYTGAFNTAVTIAGGIAGKWCTLYAYQSVKNIQLNRDQKNEHFPALTVLPQITNKLS